MVADAPRDDIAGAGVARAQIGGLGPLVWLLHGQGRAKRGSKMGDLGRLKGRSDKRDSLFQIAIDEREADQPLGQ